MKPAATIKFGGTADWVLITDNAVWVASTKPYAVLRVDPATNGIDATVRVPGEACSGLAVGFGSIWVPICGSTPALVRIDEANNTISATLPIPPADAEGGIATGQDSVWLVSDRNGTLNRIDPATNSVRQENLDSARFLQSDLRQRDCVDYQCRAQRLGCRGRGQRKSAGFRRCWA